VDPEFQRLLIRVVIVGGVVGVVGAAALFFGFRAFGRTKGGDNFRPVMLIVLAIAFILLCCVALMFLSVSRTS
jgi:hypothetical protein